MLMNSIPLNISESQTIKECTFLKCSFTFASDFCCNFSTGGEGWHTAPWWLVENYMYKRLLEEGNEEVEHLWQFMAVYV